MKNYIHFDKRVSIERIENYVCNPKKIAQHSFLPLIRFSIEMYKYTGLPNPDMNNRPIKLKPREIMYASHVDSHIYSYYSNQLNQIYNKWTQANDIDDCSLAYRNNKKRQSNIEFSAQVIKTMNEYSEAYILIGDFTKYFDNLNHEILKENLMTVMETPHLDNDWYNIFKSLTKYGYYEKTNLEEQFGSDKQMRSENKYSYFKNIKQFRDHQKNNKTLHNTNNFGIPQGVSISAVLANIYAINFDRSVQAYAKKLGGIYNRYSDDFIIVIPKTTSEKDFLSLVTRVSNLAEENKIELQKEKTKLFELSQNEIFSFDSKEKTHIDYLGFTFDGRKVEMRTKSLNKFYRKANAIVSRAKRIKYKNKLKRIPYRRHIYDLYTDYGIRRKNGNFITYAMRAQKSFDHISPDTENMMMLQIKNRKKKLEKMLGYRLGFRI